MPPEHTAYLRLGRLQIVGFHEFSAQRTEIDSGGRWAGKMVLHNAARLPTSFLCKNIYNHTAADILIRAETPLRLSNLVFSIRSRPAAIQ